jgi:4-hydroxy-tetrahydrodipicolinate reductase
LVALSKKIPIVQAMNFSIGINLFFYLVQKAACTLGPQFHPEIVEIHHAEKIDAPSGTALKLAHLITRSYTEKQTILYGRKGICGKRSDNELAIHAVRGGNVIGEHTVMFLGNDERIELCHKSGSRSIFAKGAFEAALWLYKHNPLPNLYSMQDVLNLPL